jgi:hypothetical protein
VTLHESNHLLRKIGRCYCTCKKDPGGWRAGRRTSRPRAEQQLTHKTSTERHLLNVRAVDAGESPTAIPPLLTLPPYPTLPRARAAARPLGPTSSASPDALPFQILRPPQILAARLRGGEISPAEMDKSSALEYINQMFPTGTPARSSSKHRRLTRTEI